MDTYSIRPFAADEWPVWRALRLRALADSPDAFAVTLADAQARTDDTWARLLAQTAGSATDLPLLALAGDAPAGLMWAQQDGGIVKVYQAWVAPEARGRGIAQALLERIVGWARELGASAIELGVTTGDTPAVRLYKRMGFIETCVPVPMEHRAGLMDQPMRLALR